jgi:RimJ/RimL family protein N-acetyltransferase
MPVSGIDFPAKGITDGVIALRPVTYGDVPAVVAACTDPSIRRFNSAPATEPEARAWVDGAIDGRPSSRAFRLAIADPESGRLIGSLGVPEVDFDSQRAEVGYWLAPSERGRGLATRALRLFSSWVFEALPVVRLEAIPEVDNTHSQRLLARVGFKREGVLRSYQVVHGERRDMVMYSLLAQDLS